MINMNKQLHTKISMECNYPSMSNVNYDLIKPPLKLELRTFEYSPIFLSIQLLIHVIISEISTATNNNDVGPLSLESTDSLKIAGMSIYVT